MIQAVSESEAAQTTAGVGLPTPVASFNVTQLGDAADKVGKDDNFRGMTLYNNVLYVTKGSGGNGVNTVYFVDTTGTACPTTGVGLPVANAPLPSTNLAPTYNSNDRTGQQYVRAGRLSHRLQQDWNSHRLSLRPLVCQPYHPLCRR